MMARRRLPAIRYPLSAELAYRKILLQLHRELGLLLAKHFAPQIRFMVADAMPPNFHQDADGGWRDRLTKALERVAREINRPIQATKQAAQDFIATRVSNYSRDEWRRLIRSQYGVMPNELSTRRYERLMREWATENAALIQDIPEKTLRQIRDKSIDTLMKGTNVEDTTNSMREILEERMDVSEARVRLIARDQVSKLNARFNQERQEDLGVSNYIWRTVGDERVRDTHDEADNEMFSWDSPPAITDFNHPGEDYQCRCWAEPVLPDRIRFEASLREQELAEEEE